MIVLALCAASFAVGAVVGVALRWDRTEYQRCLVNAWRAEAIAWLRYAKGVGPDPQTSNVSGSAHLHQQTGAGTSGSASVAPSEGTANAE